MKYGAVRKLCPRFYPATARYDEVPENKLTKALLPTLKSQLSVCQRTVEDAYANNGIYGNTSADHSENDLPGGLVTKTDEDIATRPWDRQKLSWQRRKSLRVRKSASQRDLFRSPGLIAVLKRRLKPTPVQVRTPRTR